jgi:hypothetical protein
MDTNGVRASFEKEITDLGTHSWTLERLRNYFDHRRTRIPFSGIDHEVPVSL